MLQIASQLHVTSEQAVLWGEGYCKPVLHGYQKAVTRISINLSMSSFMSTNSPQNSQNSFLRTPVWKHHSVITGYESVVTSPVAKPRKEYAFLCKNQAMVSPVKEQHVGRLIIKYAAEKTEAIPSKCVFTKDLNSGERGNVNIIPLSGY